MSEGPGQPIGVGRIVHYSGHNGDQHQAAIVVKVIRAWDDPAVPGVVNLQVFTDSPAGCVHMQSVAYSAEHERGSWHWPERGH